MYYSLCSVQGIYKKNDMDNSGTMSSPEMRIALKEAGVFSGTLYYKHILFWGVSRWLDNFQHTFKMYCNWSKSKFSGLLAFVDRYSNYSGKLTSVVCWFVDALSTSKELCWQNEYLYTTFSLVTIFQKSKICFGPFQVLPWITPFTSFW